MPPRTARGLVLDLVAHSREAGTPDAANAREAVARFLGECGYSVTEQPFRFNAGIYRIYPLAGTAILFVALLQPFLLRPLCPGWTALAALMVMGALVAVAATRVLFSAGGVHARDDANLIAVRNGDMRPRRWLVAHLDTKAQAQSMAGRLVAVWSAVVYVLLLVALAIARLVGPVSSVGIASGVLSGCIAGGLVMRGRLRGTSPGARDNGSGLLAVLTAAERSAGAETGVIITGAEEFALAGARALAREHAGLFRDSVVVNVDTVDDQGILFVVPHTTGSAALAARIVKQCSQLDLPAQQRRLPVGIMVDGVPLSQVAAAAVTVGRLGWGTLALLHTPRDTATGHRFLTASALGERLANPI